MEYRVPSDSRRDLSSRVHEVVTESLDLSINAALRMSRVPVAWLERQFVISFVLMNFFTAGVILCIPPSTWPLSSIAHEAKGGILRIIRASRALKHVSQIAKHTEELLTGLLKLSLQQELNNGLQQEETLEPDPGYLARALGQQPMRNSGHARVSGENEARTGDDPDLPRNPQTQLRTPSEQSASSSAEQPPATTTRSQCPLHHDTEADEHIDSAPSSAVPMYNEGNMASSADFRRPIGGYYDEQRHQVDSQLDEAFGTFGQSKSRSCPFTMSFHGQHFVSSLFSPMHHAMDWPLNIL